MALETISANEAGGRSPLMTRGVVRNGVRSRYRLWGLLIAMLCITDFSHARWSVEPGANVRNAFGVEAASRAHQCPGACGAGCASTCDKTVSFECTGTDGLIRIESFDCGTHQGCRVHDDCLDQCLAENAQGTGCQPECDANIMEQYGFESALSWLRGGAPYDGRVLYQYTKARESAPEPRYRCPAQSIRSCGDEARCLDAAGTPVDPVFDAYPDATGMRIANFRSGKLCGAEVCRHEFDVPLGGNDICNGSQCTRFGMEFDYEGADPSQPLECKTSTSGGSGDFIGDLIKLGGDAITTRADPNADDEQDGLGQLLGLFGQVIASGDAPEDINISMAPLDEKGRPIESKRVGSTPRDGTAPIPHSVTLPSSSGHLLVPMYQTHDAMNDVHIKERKLTCTHAGKPVLETVFRLRAGET